MMDYIKESNLNKNINNYYRSKHKNRCTRTNMKKKRIRERRIDTIHKIFDNLKTRIYVVFTNHKLKFDVSYKALLGCDLEELKSHISNQFKEGMTFDNYGDWEMDHIKPVSKFNFYNRSEVFECFNYINLQPLWRSENRKKYNHIIPSPKDL